MRRLYKININNDGTDNIYRIEPDLDSKSFGAKEFAVQADATMLKNFLRRCKASDMVENPRSYRALTYQQIIDLIGKESCCVYVFSHMYPKSQDDFYKIVKG